MKRKILIIRFSSIGDIVLTSPVIRCVKKQLENVELHFLVKKNFASIVVSNPFVDKVIALDQNLSSTIHELKKEGYSQIVDLQNNLKSLRIKNALGIPCRSFNKLNIEKWIFVNLKINRLPALHVVDRYLETVSEHGVVNDGLGLQFFIPQEYEVNVNEFVSGAFDKYIGVVIGAAHQTKKMPLHKWKELVSKINEPIIVLGGKDDFEEGAALSALAPKRIFNACGQFNLYQSASLIRQSAIVVTHDTGLMHIAAAFKKPIISIWGNTVPEFGMYPYYGTLEAKQVIIENKDISCRPCSKIGYASCPKGHFKCMESQNINQIVRDIKQMFSSIT
ncbi:MAG: glycosyltransferase family 9 protein [Chitinophagaceae bacterium]